MEDEMVGWYHRYNEHELGKTPGDGEGQAALCAAVHGGRKESDIIWQLNNNNSLRRGQEAGILLMGFMPL